MKRKQMRKLWLLSITVILVMLLTGLVSGCGETAKEKGEKTVSDGKAAVEEPVSRDVSSQKQEDSETKAENLKTAVDPPKEQGTESAEKRTEETKQSEEQSGQGKKSSTNSEKSSTCTISVSCANLLGNEKLDPAKTELVPEEGWLLRSTTVSITEGESVFEVLQSACRSKKLHMEYEGTLNAKTVYIEGIGNLYEFDAGSLSGWMYKVNGVFPNYGSAKYQVENGDVICWVYTCDLGKDVGGGSTGWQK